ncbi:MAG: glycosyltransferase family 2 protein [bacterium]
MKQIEIPLIKDRKASYRFFEMLPGMLSWTILILPFVIALTNVRLAAYLMIGYLLLWFLKAIALNIRVIQGFRTLKQHEKIKWQHLIDDVVLGEVTELKAPKWHATNIKRIVDTPNGIHPREVIHAVIVATYNEVREVLEPTIAAVLSSDFDPKKIILLLAYEERGGESVDIQAKQLIEDYKDNFLYAEAVKHPDGMPNEVIGKGGNITFAGRRLQQIIEQKGIDPKQVLVTTLDSDNRPHPQYFAGLTYVFGVCYNPSNLSFQPIPMFTNNIWDVPALMRVIATSNSFWMLVQSLRPHMLRNFSAHAQPLDALIKTDFWSTRTIVEDGHQFYRSYFAFDGHHEVVPIFLPIYQDAVLAKGYRRTLKAQFIQMRRWAWGASDIAYVAHKGFLTKNNMNKTDITFKFLRLLEGHISWATSPLILLYGALLPSLFHSKNLLAVQLPLIASNIETIALSTILLSMFLSFKILPPKPARYKNHHNVLMVLQWVLLPVTTICYSSFAAIYSQTRLMLGRYIGAFDVTEKAVKTDSGTITSL